MNGYWAISYNMYIIFIKFSFSLLDKCSEVSQADSGVSPKMLVY